MGYLQALTITLCYCATNKRQHSEEESIITDVVNILQVPFSEERTNEDAVQKKIKTELRQRKNFLIESILYSNDASKQKKIDENAVHKEAKLEPMEKNVAYKGAKLEPIEKNVVQKEIKLEPMEENGFAIINLFGNNSASSQIKLEKTDVNPIKFEKIDIRKIEIKESALVNDCQPLVFTKEKFKKSVIAKRLHSNTHDKKLMVRKEKLSTTRVYRKRFNQEQITHLLDVITENKEVYRLFMTEYLKIVYPDELPDNIFENFSDVNMVNLRSFTIKRKTRKREKIIITEESYDLGKLNTDFSAYYRRNDMLFTEEADKRDKLLKTLYVNYENGAACYGIRNKHNLPLDVYNRITENLDTVVSNNEKNLFYANSMFQSISMYPLILNRTEMHNRKIFCYNLLIYASTRLDSSLLTNETYKKYFTLELENVFKNFLLPDETDYFQTFILLAYLADNRNKKTIFLERLTRPEYARSIAFYHFKYLYYIFYNIHRLGPYTKDLFYRAYMDFPDSLAFLNNVIDRFITNTLYILYYKYDMDVEIDNLNVKYVLLDYVLKNGLKYLDKGVPLNERMENLLNDTVVLLRLERRNIQ